MNTSPTLTREHMFEVIPDKERNIFDKENVTAFHHSVEQLLFGTLRGRNYIQTTVDFMTTKMQEQDKDGWRKLQRILQYLHRII